MSHSVETEFSSLAESFVAAVNAADEWLGFGMYKHVLLEILLQGESFTAQVATKGFNAWVRVHVSPKSELGAVLFTAAWVLTDVFRLPLHYIIIKRSKNSRKSLTLSGFEEVNDFEYRFWSLIWIYEYSVN